MSGYNYTLYDKVEELFDSGTVILFSCEASEGFPLLSVSQNVEEILGFSSSYFLDQPNAWSSRIHPEDREKVFDRFDAILNGERSRVIYEYRFKRKNGSYIWLRDELKRTGTANDGRELIHGSSFDITDRKKTEIALRESQIQYQSVVDHIKDIAFSADERGRITFLNNSWRERTGYDHDSSLGRCFWEFIHPEDRQSFKRRFDRLLSSNRDSFKKIIRFLLKNGDFFWAEVYAKRLQDNIGEAPPVVAGTVIDVSEDIARQHEREMINRRLEERVEQRSEELQQEIEKRKEVENRLQRRLAYERAISKCANLLLEDTADETLDKSLGLLREVTACDRVYMYRNFEMDGELYLEPIAEVCGEGVDSAVDKIDSRIPYSRIKWWRKNLENQEIINAQLEEMPEEEQQILRELNVKSVLALPITVSGEWFGYIGFANTNSPRSWNDDEVRLLQTAADIISAFEKRKMIEESLVEQRNYTESILESLPSIYLLMNTDYEFIQWNRNAEQCTEYSGEELSGKTAFDLIAEEDHERLVKAAERVRKEGGGQGTELQLLTKSGKKIPYIWHGYFFELGGEHRFLCVGVDISEQKQTERELIDEKRFNEAVIESLPGIFYMIDENGNYHRWNQNFVEDLGYTSDEIERMSPSDYFEEEEFIPVAREIENVFKTGESEVEAVITTKDGSRIPYYLTGKHFAQNEKQYLVGVGYDISEQKEARQRLKQSEELFRNLFLKAPAAIAMVNPENEVQRINQSFSELFGYSEEELKGRDIDEVLVPEEELDEAPRLGEDAYTMEHFNREAKRQTKKGEMVDVFVAGIPVYVEGEPIAGFGMYIDITEQKKYEQEIYSSLKEKHVLLQEIHHRVKNNLAVVSGLIQLQMYETEDPIIRETLRESESRIQTMSLIHEKLYQSQNLSQISCKSYIGDLVETIRSSNDTDKKIEVRKDIADVQLSINKAVPFALLVNEVVTNAFKHAFEGREEGEIRVRLEEQDSHLHVHISDNGIGLPEGFDPKTRESLGMTLINNFMKQLGADGEMGSDNGTYIDLSFDVGDVKGSSDSGLLHQQ